MIMSLDNNSRFQHISHLSTRVAASATLFDIVCGKSTTLPAQEYRKSAKLPYGYDVGGEEHPPRGFIGTCRHLGLAVVRL